MTEVHFDTLCFDTLPKSTLTNKPVLHFVHANGFPAKVYTPLFDIWEQFFSVEIIELFGTNPTYPIDNNWQGLSQQVLDSIVTTCNKHQIPNLVAIGHSVGAMTTLQAMTIDPSCVSQIVLLDPSLLMGYQAMMCESAKFLDILPLPFQSHYFVDFLSPAKKSKYRKEVFDNINHAREGLKHKTLFNNFDPRCFELYLQHAFVPNGDKLTLAIPRHQEVAIFRTIPSQYWLTQPVLYRPSTLIAGCDSYFTHIGSYKKAHQRWGILVRYTKGSHMFPLEHIQTTAQLVLNTIIQHLP